MLATLTKCTAGFCVSLTFAYTNLSYAQSSNETERVHQQLFKIDAGGSRLDEDAIEWSCVEDANTGLFWQKLDPSSALHNHASYTWYQPLETNTGSQLAYPLTSPLNVSCYGYHYDDPASYCNTDAYTKRVNQTNYCGYSDWRLPTAAELTSLASDSGSTVDLNYFPFYDPFVYWTSSLDEQNNVLTFTSDMQVLSNAERSDQLLIRLVRGAQY